MEKLKIPLFPLYSNTKMLLRILEGESVEQFKHMWDTVWNLRGTPQKNVDWTEPDEWIYQRLTGDDKVIAEKIWVLTKKTLNPRWTRGIQFLMNGYNLVTDKAGYYEFTERGKVFMSNDDNWVIREIDVREGLIQLLYQASAINKGKRADFLDDWKQYLAVNSNVKKETVIKDYMRRRLVNLWDRGYMERNGNIYQITEKGLSYLRKGGTKEIDTAVAGVTKLSKEVERFNTEQRTQIRAMLEKITPTQFEALIGDLLNAMEYYNIEVTSPTNDKGVDVVAEMQHGITTVKEVIQAKRFTRGNVSRTVLDQLRGSLHRFDAFQGTIITLSD
ncbi:MAG: restriction endonuclease, partial [Taibaiella sp.]|nr:restriction endonuclease [Taibaiella sp.]